MEEREIQIIRAQRQFLWDLLDAIDTASDIFKDDYEGLSRCVYGLQQRRHTISDSDGYTVTFKEILPPSTQTEGETG